MGLPFALIWQDPLEMAWIECQTMVFSLITFLLMSMCVVKGFLGARAHRMDEELFREGMGWLFSSVDEAL